MASKSDGQIIIDSEIQTDGIQKDIQEVRASVEKIVSQLSKLEKSFEDAFSGGSAAGAVSEQNKIQSELSETEQDIKSVTDADQQLNSQMNKDASGKYKDLQSEINQTDTKMSGLKSTAGSTATSVEGAAADMSEAFNNLNDNLDEVNQNTKLGNLMGATENLSGAGEKVIDFAKSTVEMATDVQGATSRVNAYFGLTGDAADEMSTVMENVFKTGITDNLDDVSEAIISVNSNLKDLSPESLEKITSQAMTMQQVFGVDMNETMRGAQALVKGFGISADDAMDLLVTGAQNGLNYTDELGDNISEYGPRFAQLGFSASEYFSILQAGADNGAYSLDKVNDFLNEFQTSLADGRIEENIGKFSQSTQDLYNTWKTTGEGGKELFNSIISELAKMPDGYEKASLASELWSSLGEDNSLSMIESLSNVANTYDDVSGAAADMTDATTTPMQELQSKINETKLALAPLGTTLLDLATQYLPPIIEGIQNLIGFFTSLPGPVQKVITVVALLAAGFLVLAPSIASIATILSTMFAPSLVASGTAAGTSAIGFGALSIALLPIALIIAGIIAAIVAVIAIIKNWDSIVAWFKDRFNGAIEVVKGIIDGFKNFFKKAWEIIQTIFETVWDAIVNNPVVQILVATITALIEGLSTTLKGIWEGIKNIAKGAWELIKNTILAPVLLICDLVTGDFDQLKSDAQKIWNNIKNAASTIWNGIKQVITAPIQGVITFATSAFDKIKTIIVNAGNSIKSFVQKIPAAIQSAFQSAISFITSLPSKAVQWGRDIIQGIVNGIKSAIGKIRDAASSIASNIRSFLHFTVPDEGPLADADEYAPDFMELLIKGLSKNVGKVRSAAEKVASAMQIPDYNVSLPYMAQGVIAPGSSTVTYNTSNVTNNNNAGMAQILALLAQLVNQGSGGGTYEFKANINRKTLFDEIITEAKIRQGSNGKNPFELGV